MAMNYDPTAYETWRPNYEMRQVNAWLLGVVWYVGWGLYIGAMGAALCCAACCLLMALTKLRPAVRRYRMTLRLAGTPLPFIDFNDLKKLLNDPVHKKDMWLGRGFPWGQTQAQRVAELLKRDWYRTYRDALGSLYLVNFIKKNFWLCLFMPWKAKHNYTEMQKRIANAQGQPWIHGVGDGEEDIFQPVSHSEGHTLIIGTTGSGKTRCFDLLISQAILRNETVFIIDPKGDRDLRDKAKRACEMLGRGNMFLSFHPAQPDESIRIDLLANWTRPSEIADRIAALIPSATDSDPFKNFAFGALNAICSGLCSVYRQPTLKNLKHYLAGTGSGAVAGLVINALNTYLRSASPDRIKELDSYIASQKARDSESMANAFVLYYQNNGPANADMDDLISMFTHNREHFGKMITSLLPILSMLTSGKLGDLLSRSESENESDTVWHDTNELIGGNYVVYVGLDSLSDPMVGSAIGALFLSDLACVAGARYNFDGLEPVIKSEEEKREDQRWVYRVPIMNRFFKKDGKKPNTVNIFVDEAAEVVNTPFLQILNKGRGAHLKLFVATQTLSDFVSRMGSKDRAYQLLGNLNNRISLRCIDPETQKFITESLPKTKILSIQRSQGLTMSAAEAAAHGGSISERMSEEEVSIFEPQLLGMLPNLEFIASLSGGHIIKGRYPLILKDKSEYKA